ncbi:hypothetical protein K501DRAFT_324571 [Backusella circina FSU 941]|nr:hypothetical protein K501DRAFT_324571 [Backusella circina FSU 941]
MSINKTFHGYIETTKDALLLFEACKRGILPRVNRRLQDKERYLIQSGTIFCFDENESGIKRWTDGLVWSPSRILGNFLVYRELEDKKLMTRKKAIVGSLKNSYKFKRNGLIKKSISLIVDGVQQHLISYYHKDDVLLQRLNTPSNIQNLSSLEVSPGLKLRQNFRIPLFLSDDGSDDGYSHCGYQNNKSTKRKYSEFILQQQTSSPSSLIASPASSSALTPPDLIKNYSAPQEEEAPMTFKKKDTNTYSNVTCMSDSTTMIQSSSFPPLNVYNNDMFHTGSNHSNSHTTTVSTYSSLEQHRQPLIQQKLIQEQKRRQQELQQQEQQQHQKVLQKQQELQHQSHHHTDSIKRPSSYGTSFRHCSSQDIRNPSLFDQQNPHQHLFSSSSFHTINHASISQRIDPIANAFMIDIDMLLGTGWNEFELQL